MSQDRPQRQNQTGAPLPQPARRRAGLKWKIIGGLVSGVILFGILVLIVVHHEMRRLVRTQLDQRAVDIATNLGDSATTQIMKGNSLELSALVTKYSLSPGIAYALIRDPKGSVIAHSTGIVPAELRQAPPPTGAQASQRELSFRGRTVYETTALILEGRVGTVSVAMWGHNVQAEVQRVVFPVVGVLVVALAASLIFSLVLAQRITRRLGQLKELADKVSMGDLETSVAIESNDEIGDLAHSLERMRASL
ncbi:MAG TPA: HAMP domain-containing protein, partial [Candidatus Binatia bacterium]